MTNGRNELAEPFPLTKEDVQRFRADGFVKLAGVLQPETIGRYEPEITPKLIEHGQLCGLFAVDIGRFQRFVAGSPVRRPAYSCVWQHISGLFATTATCSSATM